MAKEFDPVRALFDDGVSCAYHGSPDDSNIYVVGQFAQHHTVLMMPGEEEEWTLECVLSVCVIISGTSS